MIVSTEEPVSSCLLWSDDEWCSSNHQRQQHVGPWGTQTSFNTSILMVPPPETYTGWAEKRLLNRVRVRIIDHTEAQTNPKLWVEGQMCSSTWRTAVVCQSVTLTWSRTHRTQLGCFTRLDTGLVCSSVHTATCEIYIFRFIRAALFVHQETEADLLLDVLNVFSDTWSGSLTIRFNCTTQRMKHLRSFINSDKITDQKNNKLKGFDINNIN